MYVLFSPLGRIAPRGASARIDTESFGSIDHNGYQLLPYAGWKKSPNHLVGDISDVKKSDFSPSLFAAASGTIFFFNTPRLLTVIGESDTGSQCTRDPKTSNQVFLFGTLHGWFVFVGSCR